MKLRNKKTGEITEGVVWLETRLHKEPWHCASIADLVEHWEDCKEPLIKDDEIRKVVRAWAEANGREKLLVIKTAGRLEISDGSPHLIYISFYVDETTLESLDDRTYYTIEELCGEGEE